MGNGNATVHIVAESEEESCRLVDGVNGGVKPGHWAVQNPASTAGTQASAGRA